MSNNQVEVEQQPKPAIPSTKQAQEFYFSENDFPLLEVKPEVDRKYKKVRRHAGEALIQKKLADRAYIVKKIVEDHGVGKKRKARLLSEHADEFQAFVPYSINRKNRWNTVNLEECVNKGVSNNMIKISGVEAYIALHGHNDLLATKYVERNADNTLTTRATLSVKGTPVQVLAEPPKEQKSRREKRLQQTKLFDLKDKLTPVEEIPKLHVQYTIAKSHPVTKILLGKYCKSSRNGGWKTTRQRVMTHAVNKDYLEDCGEIDVDSHEDGEVIFGRPPKDFTLGDFITQDTTPVMVRAKSIQSIDEESTSEVDHEPKPSGITIPTPKIFTDSIFVAEKFRSVQIGIHDWTNDCSTLEKRPELRFRWLNTSKTRFTVDLTSIITENPMPLKIELILYVEKLVNCPKHVSYTKIDPTANSESNPLRAAFNSRELSIKSDPWSEYRIIDADSLKPSLEEAFTDDFFESMVASKRDLDDESDLEDFERIDMDELLSDSDEKENISVPLHEVEGCDICDETNEDDVHMLENCGHKFCTNCLRTYLKHQIHKKCLKTSCFHDTCKSDVPLNFLPAILPLPLVSFYLRFQCVATHLEAKKIVTECPESKELVILCDRGDFGQIYCSKCGFHWCIDCEKAPHWPLNCKQANDWNEKFTKQYELDSKRDNCEEYLFEKRCYCRETIMYGEKREQATCGSCTRNYYWQTGKPARHQRLYTPPEFVLEFVKKTKPDNIIAMPYSVICSEMRSRRFSMPMANQFAKQTRKLTSAFKIGTSIVEHRKTVLHLLEFGYAWLYMTRTDRPFNRSSIKANLNTLRGQYDALEKEIQNSELKSVNIDGIMKKLDDSVALTIKVIEELKNHTHID